MSSVKTQSRYDSSRHLNFITTALWRTYFWAYTYTDPSPANGFVGAGSLALVTKNGSATVDADCPVGRILRTNGKKLYPDAAGIPVASRADRTPLVGVFDYHSGLSGFIDPNETVFALYNVDKPIDSIDGSSGTGPNDHKGMSVFTGGTVTAVGNITSSTGNIVATTGNIAATAGTVTVGTQLRLTSVRRTIPYTATTMTFDFSTLVGSFYSLVAVTGNTSFTPSGLPAAGTVIYIQFTGNFTVTLVTPFVFTATVAPGTTGIIVGFISNGTQLVEISRTAVTTVIPSATW
jgi:hypothetical protein